MLSNLYTEIVKLHNVKWKSYRIWNDIMTLYKEELEFRKKKNLKLQEKEVLKFEYEKLYKNICYLNK